MQSTNLIQSKVIKYKDISWDFRKDFTKYSNHGLHTYPAMMIPQVARRLIGAYGKNAKVLLDPFVGSGTALLEATLHNNFEKAYGIDINPLALLISKVKTTPIDPNLLLKEYHKLMEKCSDDKKDVNFSQKKIEKPNFPNIDFWFKPQVTTDLAIIRKNISELKNKDTKNFFLVAFSETVRDVSNTRNREYKLYRMSLEMMKKHKPDTISTFRQKLEENINSIEQSLLYFSKY